MSNATISLPQVCRPYLSSAARTLTALLLMGAVFSAGAADIDTYKVDAFAQSATNCTTTNLSDPSALKSRLHQSATRATIECQLTELKRFQDATVLSTLTKPQAARQQYLVYKAQAWLNYATYENSIKSHTAAGNHALQSADIILQALKNSSSQTLDLSPDIPDSSALMRPDLWAVLIALKDKNGIEQAPRELAFSEVALVWAAADYCEHGARQSGANFRMANRWLEQAREAYVNAHDSEANVALENLTNGYYKQYALIDSNNNSCRSYRFT
ncbi:MAG: hypothetical protein L0G25_04370, partial [Psychrobacter sp.]|nr:hypothetical protein [Psychrobacter sp.]